MSSEARRAVYFLCHCPSGYPARALPGALPYGVRTFLSRRHYTARAIARVVPADSDRLAWLRPTTFVACRLTVAGYESALRNRQPATSNLHLLPIRFLRDPILLQLLVQIAAWRVDDLGGLRDVPSGFPQLLHQKRPLGDFLVLAQRAGPPSTSLSGARPPASTRIARAGAATSMVSPGVMMTSRSMVLRNSRMLPRQRCRSSTAIAASVKRFGRKLFSRLELRGSA